MRQDLKKVLFVGEQHDQERFFQNAQNWGIVHFIDPLSRKTFAPSPDTESLWRALRVLRTLPPTEQEEDWDDIQPVQIAHDVVSLNQRHEAIEERERTLAQDEDRMIPFGDFSLSEVADIEREGKCSIQFFCARSLSFDEDTLPEDFLEVAQSNGVSYYLSVQKERINPDNMIELTFDRSLSEIQTERQSLSLEREMIEQKLKGYAAYNTCLHHALFDAQDTENLAHTQQYASPALENRLFVVEGWVPADQISKLQQRLGDLHVDAQEVAVEEVDQVPTYLQNAGFARLGEDLVHIYDTPSTGDKDPSLWVLGFFSLFFAMIVADGGYGLVYLAIALYIKYKYPQLKGAARRAVDLLTVLSVACVVWGVLTTSFFGIQVAPDNPIRRFSLIQQLAEAKGAYHFEQRDDTYAEFVRKFPSLSTVTTPEAFVHYHDSNKGEVVLSKMSDHILFELALVIGIIHLVLSLLRYGLRNPPHLGWALFLIGAYLYFPFFLQAPSMLNYAAGVGLEQGATIGKQLMIVGLVGAWVLSFYKYGWTGLFEIMTLIQVFADTLSYLRLYALGLAGAVVGATVNEIASGLPFILSVLLLVLAHGVNLVLATMSGLIHGLRLNFLEWYHYSFEGGGKQYKPLKSVYKE